MIHSNFKILEDVWWKPLWLNRTVKETIKEIENMRENIKADKKAETEEDYWTGFIKEHRKRYLRECVVTETNIDVPENIIDQIVDEIDGYTCDEFREHSDDGRKQHITMKVSNLYKSIIKIFPFALFPDLDLEMFTADLAKIIHAEVGKDLIENAGSYRKNDAQPAQEDFFYLEPNLIDEKMETLFAQCRNYFKRPDLSLENAVKYAACFLSYFLYIHPFTNGNGRVARLLTSYILSKFTVVPLSLYNGKKTREIYLNCLRSSRNFVDFSQNKQIKPDALATFILECMHETIDYICNIMLRGAK